MADEPERMDEELRLLRERRRMSRCGRTYSLFLEGLGARTGLSGEQARRAFISVLCALEPPVFVEEWRARLPVRLQEALLACAPGRETPREPARLETVLRQVQAAIGGERDRAESVTRTVLSSLRAQLTESEAEHVAEALSAELRALWSQPC